MSSVLALAVTACGGDNGDEPKGQASGKADAGNGAVEFAVDDEAKGPAPEIKDAKKGGTVKVLDLDDITHLDPARIYVNTYQGVSQMITRQLNTYREEKGKLTLVGDLATNTGKTEDGGKTWTWTLREGIKWSDGTPITAAQIKYGIERAFAPEYTEGPTYLLEWLAGKPDFRSVYDGPYKGGKQLDAVQAPDDKTIVLKFAEPHADVPFAAALTTTAPVRKEKDTKEKYDILPDASGPYMIGEHVVDKSLKLVKNPNWDPSTDPARYQFVDSYEWEFGSEPLAVNKRLIAANGDDANAITMVANVSPEVLQQVDTTPELKARTIEGLTQFVLQENINNTRVTDVEIRKALNLAYPKFQNRQIRGGSSAGDFATTNLSPTVPGYQKFDVLGTPPQGDPEAAKKILTDKGKVGMPIVYAFPNTARSQQISVAVKSALEKAGFKLVLKPIESKTFYDEIGKVNNQFDLYPGGWGADWPSASTVIPPTLDGRKIGDGAPNYSHFNDPEANAEMDRILKITDLEEAATEWGKLDKKIMEKFPYIPFMYDKNYQLYGPNVKGVFLSPNLGQPTLNGIWLES